MGAIETKKDGALRKYELPVDLKRGVLIELEVLRNCTNGLKQGRSQM